MKKTRQYYITLSLFATAVTVMTVFIVTCLKKRNFPAAVAAVAALLATGGLWYMNENRQSIVGRYCFDEGFKPDRKKKDVITELTHRRDSLPINEIPVDDETTEEDFVR